MDITITDLGGDVFAIDTAMGGYHGITAGYLIRGSRPCLIETGTALSAPHVQASLESLGVGANDLASIVVTHIHLDHAGGAGQAASFYPNAKVVVHEKGARHLVDPTKLLASAHRVFGSAMDELFGDMIPVPAERVDVLGDIGAIDLGDGRTLRAFYAPGHASHHVGLVDSHTGDLYTGDAAGVYIPETKDMRPSTPPPDFDMDTAIASIERMRAERPTRLLFSHFGPVGDIDTTLDRSIEEIRLWVDLVSAEYQPHAATEVGLDHAVAMVKERTRERYADLLAEPEVLHKFEVLSSTPANVAGIMRWLDKQAEAQS